MKTDNSSARITQHLRRLADAQLPGSRLPSVRALMAELRVSPVTVQQALDGLAREGILDTRPGQGTFVADRPDVADGLKFGLPSAGVAAAFSVFGITGVGASELFYYPYWCLEKGYARYTGRCDSSDAWARRARGWIRVMHLDAWVSMIVFTISTLAFYFMGATVLHAQGLKPEGKDMIATLSHMFVDTFGHWTEVVFLIGAGAVLFKTLYLSCAGNSRLLADFFSLSGAVRYTSPQQRATVIHRLSLVLPVIALVLFLAFKEPAWMVVFGGSAQALMLPIISGVTLYFRYRKLDRRITPSLMLDICLWIAFMSITAVAVYRFAPLLLTWVRSFGAVAA